MHAKHLSDLKTSEALRARRLETDLSLAFGLVFAFLLPVSSQQVCPLVHLQACLLVSGPALSIL